MASKKTTRRALFMSIISLLLCCSMLVGTTFAWFTDEVVSGKNVIAAGNLDVELYHGKGVPNITVDGATDLFTDVNGEEIELWEPGVVAYTNLQVVNEGSLALKYNLNMNILDENFVQYGENGERYSLADVLSVAVVPGGVTKSTRAEVLAEAEQYKTATLESFTKAGILYPENNKSEVWGLIVFWSDKNENDFDNLFNMNNGKATSDKQPLFIDLGVNLLATQQIHEEDSFGNDYDADAWLDAMVVFNEADLRAALANGGKVLLGGDIELTASAEVPAGVSVEMNLDGHTIKGTTGRDADGKRVHVLVNNGNLSLMNGTVESSGKNGGSAIVNNGTLTGKDLILTGAPQEGSGWPSYTVNNYGTMTLSDSSVTAYQGCIGAGNANAVTTLNDVTATRYGWGSSGHVFYSSAAGSKLTINGGTYTNEGNVDGTIFAGGETTVNGGTFVLDGGAYFSLNANSSLTVTNGDFSDIKTVLTWGGTMVVSGGTYGFNPTAYVADGYAAIKNGDVWTVRAEGTQQVTDGVYQNGDTYYIDNANGLKWFAAEVNQYSNYEYPFKDQTVMLTNDIDLGGMEWTPIGDYRFSANRFCGTFDGQDHTISNFKITKKTDKNDSNKSSYGFFGNMEGTVKNLTIDNATVSSYAYTGALVGRLTSGTLENCHVKNSSVECSYWQAGGMIGQLNDGCTVTGCTITNSTVTGASAIGGLCGPVTLTKPNNNASFENCTVKNCTVVQKGSFGGSYDNLFGAMFADLDAGESCSITITNCKVVGTTVKGAASTGLYNTVSGNVTVDGKEATRAPMVKSIADINDFNDAIEDLVTGDTLKLTADVDCGSLLSLDKPVTIDLNGKKLNTSNGLGGVSLKNGASIKGGTINHTGNTAAIKVLSSAGTIEDVTINMTPTAGKTKTGIQVYNGKTVDVIKNVTITGTTQGIEVAKGSHVGLIENVNVTAVADGDKKGVALLVNAASVGKAVNCTFEGDYGVYMMLNGEFHVALQLEDCTVTGTEAAFIAHDEAGISNTTNCSLTMSYNAGTEFNGAFVQNFEDECKGVVSISAYN